MPMIEGALTAMPSAEAYFGFVTFMYVTDTASTRISVIRGSFSEPSRSSPSSPSL